MISGDSNRAASDGYAGKGILIIGNRDDCSGWEISILFDETENRELRKKTIKYKTGAKTMLGNMGKRNSFFVFVILCAYLMLAPGKGLAVVSPSDSTREARINSCVNNILKQVKIIKEGINADSSADMALAFIALEDTFRKCNCLNTDAGSVLGRSRLFDFYTEIIQGNKRADAIEHVIFSISEIGLDFNKKSEVIPILKNALTHRYIGVRLEAAERLFSMGFKEDAYHFYVDLISMNPEELKRTLENRPRPSRLWFEAYMPAGKKADSLTQEGAFQRWKKEKLLEVLNILMQYDDVKSRDAIRRAITANSFIVSFLDEYKHRKLTEKSQQRMRAYFFNKFEKYMNEK
jgi:hypothetical protein